MPFRYQFIPTRTFKCSLGAFTLIEVLVVVAIIALLIAIFVPSLAKAREQVRNTLCQSNLRSIGHGVAFYLQESNGILPAAQIYGVGGYQRLNSEYLVLGAGIPENKRALNRYLKDINIFECPSDKGDPARQKSNFFEAHGTSYSYASHVREDELPPMYQPPPYGVQSCRRHPKDSSREGLPMGFVKLPMRKIVFMEPPLNPAFADQSFFVTGYPEDKPTYRFVFTANPKSHWHNRKQQHSNVLFADFHVDFTLFNEDQINSTVLGPGAAPWDQGDQKRRYY
ncbi:MAG: prepilin-type N-terminal cleavage/methylation domain-containing protein [Planctomycetota bacterium]|nr:MAG: prepilin-type N-terminal cleavage/methylation domain-containing protein [Planctomycetota bacterium]